MKNKFIEDIINLANSLDEQGFIKEANDIDYLLICLAMTADKARQILNVSEFASSDAINKAFKVKALRAHPDVGGDVETMKNLNVARDLLLQETNRRGPSAYTYYSSPQEHDESEESEKEYDEYINKRHRDYKAHHQDIREDYAGVWVKKISTGSGKTPYILSIIVDGREFVLGAALSQQIINNCNVMHFAFGLTTGNIAEITKAEDLIYSITQELDPNINAGLKLALERYIL